MNVRSAARDTRKRFDQTTMIVAGLAPTAAVVLVFIGIPALLSFFMSLHNWPLMRAERTLIGLQNYERLLQSTDFWRAAGTTASFTLLTVGLGTPLALALALALQHAGRAQLIYRFAYMVPVLFTSVATAIFWRWFYQPGSPLAPLWNFIGLGSASPLDNASWALPALALAAIWKQTGYFTLVFLAGLRTLPAELLEAARLDGATRWAEIRHVTLPLLRPTTAFVLITASIFALENFGLVYALTGGGPASSTTTVVFHLYERAFAFSELGYASAIGWALCALALPLVWAQFQLWARRA